MTGEDRKRKKPSGRLLHYIQICREFKPEGKENDVKPLDHHEQDRRYDSDDTSCKRLLREMSDGFVEIILLSGELV